MGILQEKGWVDDIATRYQKIFDSLSAAQPGRVVIKSLKNIGAHSEADLEKGVLMCVSSQESGFNNGLGMVAREGAHQLFIVGHIKVPENTEAEATQAAEFQLMREIKNWLRTGIAGMSLQVESIEQSRQESHPYGWVAAKVIATPPKSGAF